MKRQLLFVTLALLVAGTAMAQPANSICVYWDAAGTITDLGDAPGQPTYDAYVIIFVEDSVGGASYTVNQYNHPDGGPGLLYVGSVYPAGLQIGDPFTGIEVGFQDVGYGFGGAPVLIETLTFVNQDFPLQPKASLFLTPHPNYLDLIYADFTGVINNLSTCPEAVGNDDATFGEIKSMFR